MTVYTQISRKELDQLLAQYDIGAVIDFEGLRAGQANSNFKLTARTGTYILSICDEKDFSEVEQLAGILLYLEKRGFQTTRVIKSIAGNLVVSHDDKPAFLKYFLEGSIPDEISQKNARRLGREIACLHQIKPPPGLPSKFAYGLECFGDVIDASADSEYRLWLKSKMAYLEKAISPELPRSIVHGDIFYDNTLFKDDELIAIIDFEEVCNYYRIFDLGMCAVGSCAGKGGLDFGKTRALMEGYNEIEKLQELEKKRFQTFIIYAATATSFWRFRQYNLLFPNHRKSKTYTQMNLIADQLHAFPPDDFMCTVFS